MAELPNLGKRCQVTECEQLDFLPFVCNHCQQTFCLEHRSPSGHNCQAYQKEWERTSHVSIAESASQTTQYPCTVPSCSNQELVPVICKHCKQNVCLRHRHQCDHDCPKLTTPEPLMAKTKALVDGIIASSQSDKAKPACRGRKSAATRAKVQLMKMKLHAIGDEHLPQEERIYLNVHLPLGHKNKEKAYFFSKHWSVGKAVDFVALRERLENNNNVSTAMKLCLFSTMDGSVFSMADSFNVLVEQGFLTSGGSVIMEYVQPGCTFLEKYASYAPNE